MLLQQDRVVGAEDAEFLPLCSVSSLGSTDQLELKGRESHSITSVVPSRWKS